MCRDPFSEAAAAKANVLHSNANVFSSNFVLLGSSPLLVAAVHAQGGDLLREFPGLRVGRRALIAGEVDPEQSILCGSGGTELARAMKCATSLTFAN